MRPFLYLVLATDIALIIAQFVWPAWWWIMPLVVYGLFATVQIVRSRENAEQLAKEMHQDEDES